MTSFTKFLNHTQRHITLGRTPLDAWSARRRDIYLTTHNTRKRQTSMTPVGFEPTISAGERPQTHALDRGATGTDPSPFTILKCIMKSAFRRASHCEILVSFLSYHPTVFQMASSVRCHLPRCCSWGRVQLHTNTNWRSSKYYGSVKFIFDVSTFDTETHINSGTYSSKVCRIRQWTKRKTIIRRFTETRYISLFFPQPHSSTSSGAEKREEGKEGLFIAVVPKLRSTDLKASATSSHGIRGYISLSAALKINTFLN